MQYDKLANRESLNKTVSALKQKGYEVDVLKDGKEALSKIKELIPAGVSVLNGASVTLSQIGFVEYLKSGQHGWNNIHELILAEKDAEKQTKLRRSSVLSEYYLGSVHALLENGDFIIASNSGSQLPHIAFTSPNLIFVISSKKIVPDMNSAMERLEEYVIPLEDKRMMKVMNMHTMLNKILILKGEPAFLGRKVHVILVEEDLGF
jgi:hypothetical protein